MEYWTEKCPNCGFKSRMTSLSNKNGFGSPLIACENCGKPYIHPGRIELGVLSDKELRTFKARMVASLIWRHAIIFAAIPYALVLSFVPGPAWVSTVVGITMLIFSVWLSFHVTNKRILQELPLSNERLLSPGYRQILEDAKYKPYWDIL